MYNKLSTQIIGTARNFVKEHHSSKNWIIRLGISFAFCLRTTFRTLVRIYKDKDYRAIVTMLFLNKKNVHQTNSLTFMDRYPTIFKACKDYFNHKTDLKILSYGCSTGEEVLTLRKYFPTGHIIGAEINKNSLAICKKLNVDENITFIYSTPKEIEKYGTFDAIFCMAVLQRKPHYIASKGITNLKKIYPFEKFEEQIIELDKLIKPGGLLIVHYTQYTLKDTKVTHKYKALEINNQKDYLSPVFDKYSNLIKDPIPQHSIFIKQH
ncbi:class I SAM-dependent methyltransferase [Bacillus sp. PS06]|uniref:class I SAM-dependent methyltransferase n=1 Tax=Bacillus sp. PS06 TaxID=2764176 RepID=UPI0017857B53|nr:class I SAM-dependent methyltransferase [Bacillus sp. PS06]MBD8071113.1 methyltransferase domain-containing protein [Bacillus sp. PS06]